MTDYERIMFVASRMWELDQEYILNSTSHHAARIRHVVIAVIHRVTGWSQPQMGRIIGRDSSTVSYGMRHANPEAVERLYNAVKSAKVAEQSKETENYD